MKIFAAPIHHPYAGPTLRIGFMGTGASASHEPGKPIDEFEQALRKALKRTPYQDSFASKAQTGDISVCQKPGSENVFYVVYHRDGVNHKRLRSFLTPGLLSHHGSYYTWNNRQGECFKICVISEHQLEPILRSACQPKLNRNKKKTARPIKPSLRTVKPKKSK